jgi:hypothetical protein
MADYIDACQGSCGASPHDLTKQFRLGMPSWHDTPPQETTSIVS